MSERERERERERETQTHIIPVLCVVFLLNLSHPCAVLLDDTLQLLGVVLLQFQLVSLKTSYGVVQLDSNSNIKSMLIILKIFQCCSVSVINLSGVREKIR